MKARNLAMFVILYLAATCVSISQIKIVPVLEPLCTSLGVTYASTSWLMSVFTVAGIVLAIPAGSMIAKFGPKKIFATVLVISFIGNVMGALSLDNFTMLLISRIVEGCAFAMVSIAGVVFIDAWFPEKQGLFNGLYTTFGAIGSFAALNGVLPLYDAVGLSGIWWITATAIAAFAVLVVFFVEDVNQAAIGLDGEQAAPAEKPRLGDVLSRKTLVLIGCAQLVCGFILYFYINNYPSVYEMFYGLDATTANFFGSICSLAGIPFCIVGGLILDRIGPRKSTYLMTACFALLVFACLSTTHLSPALYVVHPIVLAMVSGILMTAEVYIVPFCVKQFNQIGLGVSLQTFGYNIGIFIGNPIIMYAVQGTGSWNVASYILCAAAVVGLLIMFAFIRAAKTEDTRIFTQDAPATAPTQA